MVLLRKIGKNTLPHKRFLGSNPDVVPIYVNLFRGLTFSEYEHKEI